MAERRQTNPIVLYKISGWVSQVRDLKFYKPLDC